MNSRASNAQKAFTEVPDCSHVHKWEKGAGGKPVTGSWHCRIVPSQGRALGLLCGTVPRAAKCSPGVSECHVMEISESHLLRAEFGPVSLFVA